MKVAKQKSPYERHVRFLLSADQRGIEPPPAVCQRYKSDVIPTEPYERHVRKSNTALCGNQGSPQPGAPRSHRAGHTGIIFHRSGAIPRPAMTQSRSRRKGETDSETELKVRLDSRVSNSQSPLRVHSVDLFLASSSSQEGHSQCHCSRC